MTEEEAEKKLLKIAEESAKRMAKALIPGPNGAQPPKPGEEPPKPGEEPKPPVSGEQDDEDDQDEYDQQSNDS